MDIDSNRAQQILSLLMDGMSVEKAMETVIGPGDWSEQASEVERVIEGALKNTYARIEDWNFEKAFFDGANCGIASGGFQPGNTCAGGDKTGKKQPKPKSGRKKVGSDRKEPTAKPKKKPSTEATPKAPKASKAPKTSTTPKTPAASRKPKSPPKPKHIERAKKAIAQLGKTLSKMKQKTLKNLLARVKAAKKTLKTAPKSLRKKAKDVRSSLLTGIKKIKSRSEQKQKRKQLRAQSQKVQSDMRKVASAANETLNNIYNGVRGQEDLQDLVRTVADAQNFIANATTITKESTHEDASTALGGMRRKSMLEALTPANIKKLVAHTAKSYGDPKLAKSFEKTLKEMQAVAKQAEGVVRNWNKVEAKRFARQRIEDKFYRLGDKTLFIGKH
jgi:hypothetical protein